MPMKKNRRKERQAKRRAEEKHEAELLDRRTYKSEPRVRFIATGGTLGLAAALALSKRTR